MMTRNEKIANCQNFMDHLGYLLGPDFIMLPSCNCDISEYLIPSGTEDELTYYGKPDCSFRFSDHWNWYTSLKKCKTESLVQCRSMDMPWARRREKPGEATKPRYGIQVCVFDRKTQTYHHVYGDRFDRNTKTWTWVPNNAEKVADQVLRLMGK